MRVLQSLTYKSSIGPELFKMHSHRLGSPQRPFMWEYGGRHIPVVFVSEQIRPYRIAAVQDVADAPIIVTSEGPFDAIDWHLLSFRHTHWDDGLRDVWGQALTQANRGCHHTCPFPLRDQHTYLQQCFLHLQRTREHPRWHLITGTDADRKHYTLGMYLQDARAQGEREMAAGVFLQDWCRWCGQPTSRTCDGFVVATYVHPYTIGPPYYMHECGSPICAACDTVFESCYRCSFWAGLPLLDPREPLRRDEPLYTHVLPSGSGSDMQT